MRWQVTAPSRPLVLARLQDAAREKGCTECGSPACVGLIESALNGGMKAAAWCESCAGGAKK